MACASCSHRTTKKGRRLPRCSRSGLWRTSSPAVCIGICIKDPPASVLCIPSSKLYTVVGSTLSEYKRDHDVLTVQPGFAMVLLSILTLLAALSQPVVAEIKCCGALGFFDEKREKEIWAARESFCRNPRAHKRTNDTEEGYTEGKNSFFTAPRRSSEWTYLKQLKAVQFYGRIDKGSEFTNCWRATEELINKCARDEGKAHGSWWDRGGEHYGMSLADDIDFTAKMTEVDDSRRRRRRSLAKRSLDELSVVSSEAHLRGLVPSSDFFDVDGEDIKITFVNSVESLPKRDLPSGPNEDGLWRRSEGLATTEGIAYNWNETYHSSVNLAEIIKRDLARIRAREEEAGRAWNITPAAEHTFTMLGKRDELPETRWYQTCDTERANDHSTWLTWTPIQAGHFLRNPIPTQCVGQDFLTLGMRRDILLLQKEDKVCESYSFNIYLPWIKHMVRAFAKKRQFNWSSCVEMKDLPGSRDCADKWRASKGKQ